MSARDVADLLAVAHQGFTTAIATRDLKLRSDALRVAERALHHPDAGAFFGGLALALSEEPFGNDPDVESNDGGVANPNPATPDEDSPASSPAYEGVTDGEEEPEQSEDDERQDARPEQEEQGGAVALVAAVANWSRINAAAARG